MTEFLNQKLNGRKVVKVEKNPISKSKTDMSLFPEGSFSAFADFQGKEMKLTFDPPTKKVLLLNFSKIGYIWHFDSLEAMSEYEIHCAQLRFTLDNGALVCLMDKSRFSTWSWNGDYRSDRSPDIVLDHNRWRKYMQKNRNHPAFSRAVFELMLHPKFFNGVGNISRAEILARTRFSPFSSLKEILEDPVLREDLFETCKETLDTIYMLGGAQFKQWSNPFGHDRKNFVGYLKAYRCFGGMYCKDSINRTFWFEPKWKNHYVMWASNRNFHRF